ncbi:hypothetical protein O6H91_08G088600 [Diphasiastrum complanatum]|uniref:Uncharacterized protein n=1 Tax=Diphasiastrum complanatum TaxID=34168 RepID=A0ACC2CZL1_DIPCM|nr:hypothetical protein O6H91_08G088600 [Diphasiastrum complanatum]
MDRENSLEDVPCGHSEELMASLVNHIMSPERNKGVSAHKQPLICLPMADSKPGNSLERCEQPFPKIVMSCKDSSISADYAGDTENGTDNLLSRLETDHDPINRKSITDDSSAEECFTTRATVSDSSPENYVMLDYYDFAKKTEVEAYLFELVCKDDSSGLVSTIHNMCSTDGANNGTDVSISTHVLNKGDMMRQRLPCTLFQLACKLDRVACASIFLNGDIGCIVPIDWVDDLGCTALHYAAESHSIKCIELLLQRRAKTELKSKNGYTPLEIAIHSKRLHITWSPSEEIFKLLESISEKNLTAIKILAAHTRDVLQLARQLAMHGNVVALATLLLITGDSLLTGVAQKTEDHCEETLLDVVVKKALSLREETQGREFDTGYWEMISMERDILCKEIELLLYLSPCLSNKPLHLQYKLTPSGSTGLTPLIRAVQARDEAIVRLLLSFQADVINETDVNGNTCLHWCLKSSLQSQSIRILAILLEHGASVTLGNRLGLTPIHIAAGQGNLHALQILLNRDPQSVHATAETKETPLFSAVKNNHLDCARVLLQYGANRQVMNLRKQRPIDVANTADMRALLFLQDSSSLGKVKEMKETMSVPETGQIIKSETSLSSCAKGALYETELLNSRCAHFLHRDDQTDSCSGTSFSVSRHLIPAKTEICRYFGLPSGCVRGDKCFYAHGEEELGKAKDVSLGDTKPGFLANAGPIPSRSSKRSCEDLSKKIFVGGLSPTVESDLRDFFEEKFGPVLDAIVIGSHSGDQIHSRGFGFVTFKHEESASAAVAAHYVNIFGKKVEIKEAVPRSILATPSMAAIDSLNDISSFLGNQACQSEETKNVDLSSRILPSKTASENLEIQWLTKVKYQHQPSNNDPNPLKIGEGVDSGSSLSTATKSASSLSTQTSPAWVKTFRQWLPKFLAEVSSRLKEGEWYPLSSLKGDFRATCGMELDHLPLGFTKLSDFIRSMPELCRMKIVPVGRGPATHMVLLQTLPRPTLNMSTCASNVCGLLPGRSLVDADRSYAAAAGQAVRGLTSTSSSAMVSSLQVKRNPPTKSAQLLDSNNHINEVALLPPTDGQLVAQAINCPNQIRIQSGIPATSFVLQNFGIGTKYVQEQEDLQCVSKIFAQLNRNEEQSKESSSLMSNLQSNNSIQVNSPHALGSLSEMDRAQYCMLKVPEIDDSHISFPQQEIRTPIKEGAFRSFTSFNQSFSGFLQQENSFYSTNPVQGRINETPTQPLLAAETGNCWPHNMQWQNSPQSILSPFEMRDSYINCTSPVNSLMSENTHMQSDRLDEICVRCSQRRALWAAVPCGHRALCAFCKDSVQKVHWEKSQCFLCESYVESWIALH